MNEPLSFSQWCYEVDIEAQYQRFYDEYGYSACSLTEYKERHYEEYLQNFSKIR